MLPIGARKIDLHGPSSSNARRPFSLPGWIDGPLMSTTKSYVTEYPIVGGTATFGPAIDENNELISHGTKPNQIIHVHDQHQVSVNVVNPASPQVTISDNASGPDNPCKG